MTISPISAGSVDNLTNATTTPEIVPSSNISTTPPETGVPIQIGG